MYLSEGNPDLAENNSEWIEPELFKAMLIAELEEANDEREDCDV